MIKVLFLFFVLISGKSLSLFKCRIMLGTLQTDEPPVKFALDYNVTELEETARVLGGTFYNKNLKNVRSRGWWRKE